MDDDEIVRPWFSEWDVKFQEHCRKLPIQVSITKQKAASQAVTMCLRFHQSALANHACCHCSGDEDSERKSFPAKVNPHVSVNPWQAMHRDEFIQVMGDFLILSLQTDLTRVATLMTPPERWPSPLKVDG